MTQEQKELELLRELVKQQKTIIANLEARNAKLKAQNAEYGQRLDETILIENKNFFF